MWRKRLVRIHLDNDNPSLEGLIRHLARPGGHYVLELANLIEGEARTFKLDGDKVRIPRERVVFVQQL